MLFSKVTALAKAQVFLGVNPFHFREEVLDFGNNRFIGTVIQNNNLRIDSFASIAHRLEACRNEVARVISNDNDGTGKHIRRKNGALRLQTRDER